jgi:hypothetical protein
MKRIFFGACFALLSLTEFTFGQAGPPLAVKKICGKCKQVVPDDSKSGNKCPFCGVKWADDDESSGRQEKGKPNIQSSPYPSHAWDRVAESDSYTYGSFIWRWVVIGVGVVVSTIIVMYTVRFLKNNV